LPKLNRDAGAFTGAGGDSAAFLPEARV
jgi:hypothetical protein